MRIAMIGTGYVGLVSGACFSQFGFEVVCVDKDAGKIEAGTPAFRRVTVAAFSCGFSIFAILYCPQPVLPLLTQEFGITPAQSSLTVSLPCITMAVAMLFVSSLSDVLGRKPLMMGVDPNDPLGLVGKLRHPGGRWREMSVGQ